MDKMEKGWYTTEEHEKLYWERQFAAPTIVGEELRKEYRKICSHDPVYLRWFDKHYPSD
jgi:hypothetical protein